MEHGFVSCFPCDWDIEGLFSCSFGSDLKDCVCELEFSQSLCPFFLEPEVAGPEG